MKLKLDPDGYVTGYTEFCQNYASAPGTEYTGPVPENFASVCCNYRYENGTLVLDEEKAARRELSVQIQAELSEIEAWFLWYDNQCMQYQRSVRLGEAFDQDIALLDHEAKTKQTRAREIRILLGGNDNGNV